MKFTKLRQSLAVASLLGAGLAAQAAEVWSESFETDGQGTRYTSSPEFNAGSSDHWGRTDGSNIANVSGPYTGFDGSYFWAAEDTDHPPGSGGGDGNDEQVLTIIGIDISGYTNLAFTGLFGAGNESIPGASSYDRPDHIIVEYQIDGGGYANGVCFNYENHGDNFNEPIGLDADCDGESDGVAGRLGAVLSEYGFTIVETGSLLDIRIKVYADADKEELAFDNLKITGDGGGGGDIAPSVISTIPADTATGVAVNTNVTINFSETIDASALAVTMTCTSSGAITFSTGLPASGVSQLVLTPASVLTDGETCDVTVVATEITDTDGTPDAMAADYPFSFMVGFPTVEIFEIQGPGMTSPYEGQTVSTNNNIVTALSNSGFFMQTPDARDDADAMTSNGIFVYTGGAPTVLVGDEVNVSGEIVEFFDFTEFANPSSQTITVVSQGNALPTAVLLDDTYPPTNPTQFPCGSEAMGYECVEGMWFTMPQGFISSTYVSFYGANSDDMWVKAGPNRAFREPGIDAPGLPGLPLFDGNPELLEVDMDGLGLGLPAAGFSAGSEISMTGVFGYDFGEYELWPSSLVVINENTLPASVPAAGINQLTLGSANLYRLFDAVDDAGPEDDGQVADPIEYAMRLSKIAKYVVEDMASPLILAVQEVEHITALNDLANAISTAGGPTYTTVLIEGNDRGGIDVGYLYNNAYLSNVQINQLGANEINNFDGSLLHDRPPLQLSADVVLADGLLAIEVLNVHQRSRSKIDDAVDGDRVRHKRLAQSQSVALMIDAIQTAKPDTGIYVVGDFNGFQFTDGYVDVLGQIAGTAVDGDNLLWEAPIFAAQPLTIATQLLPANEQYSYVYQGDAQALDHALINDVALVDLQQMRYVRGQADAALQYESDGTSSLRSTDHDGFVLYISPDLDLIFKDGFE